MLIRGKQNEGSSGRWEGDLYILRSIPEDLPGLSAMGIAMATGQSIGPECLSMVCKMRVGSNVHSFIHSLIHLYIYLCIHSFTV